MQNIQKHFYVILLNDYQRTHSYLFNPLQKTAAPDPLTDALDF